MKEYFKIFLKIWNFWLEIVRRQVTLKMRAWRKILSSKTKMRMFRSFYTLEYAAVWTAFDLRLVTAISSTKDISFACCLIRRDFWQEIVGRHVTSSYNENALGEKSRYLKKKTIENFSFLFSVVVSRWWVVCPYLPLSRWYCCAHA